MLNKTFIKSLKKEYLNKTIERRQIISASNIILNNSKKTIFALHRQELDVAQKLLNDNEKSIQKLIKKFTYYRLTEEGSFMAALEEYVEAKLFFNYIHKGKIEKIKEIKKLPIESYIGGLSDFTGELLRLAINESIEKKFNEVKRIKKLITEILNELIDFDITGPLRTKYDQARNNLKKIEQMDYEISLKNI